jgi:hypothetical protein
LAAKTVFLPVAAIEVEAWVKVLRVMVSAEPKLVVGLFITKKISKPRIITDKYI